MATKKYHNSNFRFRKNTRLREAAVVLVTEDAQKEIEQRELIGIFDIPDYFLTTKGTWGTDKRMEYGQCLADRCNRRRGLTKKNLVRCRGVKPKALTPIAAMIMPGLKEEADVTVAPITLRKAESERLAEFVNTEGRSLQPIYAMFRTPPSVVSAGAVLPTINTPVGQMRVLV